MTKTFRHKTTNEVATYKDGVLKSSGFSVEIGVEPSSQFWEDITTVECLLKSVDGVELFEGDSVYGIHAGDWKVFELILHKGNGVHVERWEHGKFSSKEAAQEYILMNRPCLSVEQVKNILSNYGFITASVRKHVYKDLENLSKSISKI
jgi:hypothetical protein